MRFLLIGLAAFSLMGAQAAAPADPPSSAQLESFISYAFHGDLVAAPRGDRIAWFELRKGVRNVWVAAGPDFRPRRVTDATRDDGQELTGLVWSPDGKRIAWTRGGDHHRNPWAEDFPPPNPASDTEEPKLEIWTALAAGGAPMKIAEGDAPVISRTGRIAFLKDDQAWAVDPRDGKPERLFYDRGKIDSLVWSPDGSRLAFVSTRIDHSFIGIYAGPDTPITWLAPSSATDADPVWSPDGRRIAFSRIPGIGDIVPSNLVDRPRPFTIMVASAADGAARTVWRSPHSAEGSYPTAGDGFKLMWAAGDRLIFTAELDNWLHLYSLPASGGDPVLLTPGKYMAEHIRLSPDGGYLLYSANSGPDADDVDRRHLFRVAVDRPGPVALTSGTNLEWTPAPLTSGRLAYVSVTPTTPTRITIANADGSGARRLDTPGADFSGRDMVVPRHITFKAPDGLTIHGQLFAGGGGGAKKPGIIFVHGGPSRQMLLGWSYMDYYAHSYAMNQYLAARGFMVLSVNYRLGIGYGRAFQRAPGGGLRGSSEYQDVLAGAHYLQKLPGVDAGRIGIWGGSYGGLLTAQALARNSDVFKAGVDLHGVHDFTLNRRVAQPTRYEQGDYAAALKKGFESSPIAHMDKWRSPVLLIHGDADGNVPFFQTVDVARRLQTRGIPFEELIFPNEVHGFLRYDSWLKADMATVRFFEDRLKP